jgi:hypothetical protein
MFILDYVIHRIVAVILKMFWDQIVLGSRLYNTRGYLPSALKHLFGCHFKHLWKKRNIIVTFQSGQLKVQPKTLDDLGRFDLKMFSNCPIRIEIITGSHIFILFLPLVVTLCLHFTPRYRSWLNIRHKVPTRGKNNINIWLPVIIS